MDAYLRSTLGQLVAKIYALTTVRAAFSDFGATTRKAQYISSVEKLYDFFSLNLAAGCKFLSLLRAPPAGRYRSYGKGSQGPADRGWAAGSAATRERNWVHIANSTAQVSELLTPLPHPKRLQTATV